MAAIRSLFLFGTRPEAIKLAPVIHECRRRSNQLTPIVWVTAQHRELLDLAMIDFELKPDVDLNLMRPSQSPMSFLGRCLEELEGRLPEADPHCVIVQGDTTSALAGALVAFHHKIPIVHVEAGLRTGDLSNPFPEEFNRRTITLAATLHCAPTPSAAAALQEGGIAPRNVRVTGNTVIDALRWMLANPRARGLEVAGRLLPAHQPVVLVTVHRRESFGAGLTEIIRAIMVLVEQFPEVTFVWPVHRNPVVREAVRQRVRPCANLALIDPLPYSVFAPLLARSSVVLTDSGGVQEEATYLQIPMVVIRGQTERPEAIQSGEAELVGTDFALIIDAVSRHLKISASRQIAPVGPCPFGDGRAAERIVDWILERFASKQFP